MARNPHAELIAFARCIEHYQEHLFPELHFQECVYCWRIYIKEKTTNES